MPLLSYSFLIHVINLTVYYYFSFKGWSIRKSCFYLPTYSLFSVLFLPLSIGKFLLSFSFQLKDFSLIFPIMEVCWWFVKFGFRVWKVFYFALFFLWDIFLGYRVLGWQFSSFSTLKDPVLPSCCLHCFWLEVCCCSYCSIFYVCPFSVAALRLSLYY